MTPDGKHVQYSCVIHGQWPNNGQYVRCPVCKDECFVIHVEPHEVMSNTQASAKQSRLLAEEAAARDAEAKAEANRQALEAQHREHTIRAATAALHYDLDHWLEVEFRELAEWAGISGDPTAWARQLGRKPTGTEGYTAS